ncbi:MAG: hypothetical protein KBD52_02290 [Candidatus Pacebacteria bacterium]|nr:hypothetical protein [Candidatus Paceibacterota bacterium]
MSLKQHIGISIIGLGNVMYPAFLTELQKAWDSKISSFITLNADFAEIPALQVGIDGLFVTTNDKYRWYTWLTFQPNPNDSSSSLIFLLPWTKDWEKKDGSQSDRSIGVIEVGDEGIISKITADNALIKQMCAALASERKVQKIS